VRLCWGKEKKEDQKGGEKKGKTCFPMKGVPFCRDSKRVRIVYAKTISRTKKKKVDQKKTTSPAGARNNRAPGEGKGVDFAGKKKKKKR